MNHSAATLPKDARQLSIMARLLSEFAVHACYAAHGQVEVNFQGLWVHDQKSGGWHALKKDEFKHLAPETPIYFAFHPARQSSSDALNSFRLILTKQLDSIKGSTDGIIEDQQILYVPLAAFVAGRHMEHVEAGVVQCSRRLLLKRGLSSIVTALGAAALFSHGLAQSAHDRSSSLNQDPSEAAAPASQIVAGLAIICAALGSNIRDSFNMAKMGTNPVSRLEESICRQLNVPLSNIRSADAGLSTRYI